MDWFQVFTIIGVLGAFMFWIFQKLDTDIQKVEGKIETAHRRMDQLYQVIIDLLKQGR